MTSIGTAFIKGRSSRSIKVFNLIVFKIASRNIWQLLELFHVSLSKSELGTKREIQTGSSYFLAMPPKSTSQALGPQFAGMLFQQKWTTKS